MPTRARATLFDSMLPMMGGACGGFEVYRTVNQDKIVEHFDRALKPEGIGNMDIRDP